jgi:APA family basic amino acid/polyamine antiporter
MGADGVFFRKAGHLHPRYRTPDVALIAQSAWAIVLALSGTYGQLLDYSTFADWLGYSGAVATLFYYRKLQNEAPAFRAPGFPILPGIFVLVTLATVISNVIASPRDAGMALLIALIGVPVYFYWTRVHRT